MYSAPELCHSCCSYTRGAFGVNSSGILCLQNLRSQLEQRIVSVEMSGKKEPNPESWRSSHPLLGDSAFGVLNIQQINIQQKGGGVWLILPSSCTQHELSFISRESHSKAILPKPTQARTGTAE